MPPSKARQLRRNPTETERFLWRHLRYRQMNGHKFRRQHPIGQYIVDFACIEKGLVIELDGGQHSQRMVYDTERTTWLKAQGFRTLRFWDNQVLQEVDGVKAAILEALETPPS